MSKDFVHLHLHTDFSLLDGANPIKPLVRRVSELNMTACAITDHGNMYGAISFYNAMKAQNVKPIIGCEVYYTRGSRHDRSAPATNAPGEKLNHHMVLLAKDYEGYQNLVRLTSKAFTEGFYYKPRIDAELLSAHSKGLIGLSACMSGVPTALLARGAEDEATREALRFEEILGEGNYFIELQDHGLEMQAKVRQPLIDLSRRTGIPLVATNDVHYLTPEDARAHDILLCIGSGKTVNDANRLRYGSSNFYLRTADEMWQLFGDVPDALRRTCEIAEMCDLKLPSGVNHVPVYPIPEADRDLSGDEYFEKIAREGYERRRAQVWEPLAARGELRYTTSDYQARLSSELAMIKRMGFASYFLIVWDIVRYARENDVPVGPGRGSAAGSLVAYCLEITDVDPLQYDLLFERFLNPERVSMPDIDIDFCVRGREKVINHVIELYGRESVCQIITFGTMASKAAIKDVGRAMDLPYAEVDRIAKLIPPPVRGRNVSIAQALEQVPDLRSLRDGDARVGELIEVAQRLEGCARHSSVHAAGVVISPKPLCELVPTATSPKSELTTQYAMSDLEKTGMLKMDFLALTTLTIISDCLNTLKQSSGVEVDWSTIPFEDDAAMALFGEGRTDAIFQFESQGMQEICRRLRPKCLEDLAALNALYRPGPLDGGMVDDYIQRHHGKKSVRYIIPQMKEVLSNTYGIIVYQEQIMQLAQRLAGYTLAEADLMRRAMGKKNREEMARHEQKFIAGAVERDIAKEKAEQIFSLMAQFADYGFNRSHSVAYAFLAFQTAFLKAHHPAHFYAAVLSNEIDDSAKVLKYAKELQAQGIKLLPPDVNESAKNFTPVGEGVRYGLAAIKGLGESSVEAILQARAGGAFTSLHDFVMRVDQRGLNKRVLEALVSAGAFDSLNREHECCVWRSSLHAAIESSLAYGARLQKSESSGQSDLFGSGGGESNPSETACIAVRIVDQPWSTQSMLGYEKAALGFYITGHPLAAYSEILCAASITNLEACKQVAHKTPLEAAGVIVELQVKTTKKGDKFAILHLEDDTSRVKCLVWSAVYAKHEQLLKPDAAVLLSGRADASDDGGFSIIADKIEDLSRIPQTRSRNLLVEMPAGICSDDHLGALFATFDKYKGDCTVSLQIRLENGIVVQARPHGAIKVARAQQLETELLAKGFAVCWQSAEAKQSASV